VKSRSRLVAAAALAFAALAGLVGVGRWEGARHADDENRGIARIRALVGPLDSPTLEAYRLLPQFSCLLYRRGGERLALELCVDGEGRVVEAIDRRGRGDPEVASIREDPEAATVRVDRSEVDRLIRELQQGP
jgi:hypothetical protein